MTEEEALHRAKHWICVASEKPTRKKHGDVKIHTMPLAEVQRGFEIASQYLDNVVKLVIEL